MDDLYVCPNCGERRGEIHAASHYCQGSETGMWIKVSIPRGGIYFHERLAMGAYSLGVRYGWKLGHLLAEVLWRITPLRPRLAAWALRKEAMR